MSRQERQRDTLHFVQLLPSLLTIVGLCAGLTSIRYAFADRYDVAAALIIVAAAIDGLDGLLARRLDAASRMGAELDTLSDFLNFGVAPGLLVFQFALADLRGLGWAAVLLYVICCCLRLARFNVGRQDPRTPGRAHFVGVPAPGGALLAMLPVFLGLAGLTFFAEAPIAVALYLGLIGLLMVSRIPTFSLKSVRFRREHAVWLLAGAALLVGLMTVRLWLIAALADVAYLVVLLVSLVRNRRVRTGEEKLWNSNR